MSAVEQVAVAIVGGGPSGLTAAANLAQAVDGPVLVLERERHTGGILATVTTRALASVTSIDLYPALRMLADSPRPQWWPGRCWRPRPR